MRRTLTAAVPLLIVGIAGLHAASGPTAEAARYSLFAYNCATCEHRLLTQGVALDVCQREAYALNDGSDDMTVINPKGFQKFECRPLR